MKDPACCHILHLIRVAITLFKEVEVQTIDAEICIFHIHPMPNQLGKLRAPSNQTKQGKRKWWRNNEARKDGCACVSACVCVREKKKSLAYYLSHQAE